jgi:DNA helicase HerA-like ATPase
VFVDEAQLFAPSADNGEDREVRKASLLAMTNLMCRGRKRGLAGVLATQRLAKLHKNVAAEASNFLMGRTFLDIDIARAGDLLGLKPQQAEQIRDLARGEFLGLGPAISRKPLKVRIGTVLTEARAGGAQGLVPLPNVGAPEMKSLMLPPEDDEMTSAPALRIVK